MTPEELPSENSPEITGSSPVPADLAQAARQLTSRLAHQNKIDRKQSGLDLEDDVFEDNEAALRWRQALLRLSETFLDAAEERRDLSPILLGALHNALEQLLIHGEEADLMALEDWLAHEDPTSGDTSTPGTGRDEQRTSDFIMAGAKGAYNGVERRSGIDRRSSVERRKAQRRN